MQKSLGNVLGEIFIEFTRSGHVETVHRGHMVAVDTKAKIVDALGEPYLPMYWRSSAKPFQALPFVRQGGLEKYKITEEELAVFLSSHSGEPLHVKLVKSVLKKIALTEEDLNCGVMRPMSSKVADQLIADHKPYKQVHNACSGKHSQILALSQMLGIPTKGYIESNHEAQKIILQHVALATNLKEDEIDIGVDGCGVPVFYLPLFNMAFAYARLTTPKKGAWGEFEEAITTIRNAMLHYPLIVAGTGRIDVAVNEVTNGRILAKIGSDGIYCLGVKDENIGIAFKIEDGVYRAITPAVIGVLNHLGLLTQKEHKELLKLYPPVIKNHRGDIIGTIETLI